MQFSDLEEKQALALVETFELIIKIGQEKANRINPAKNGHNLEQVEAAVAQTNAALTDVQEEMTKSDVYEGITPDLLTKVCHLVDSSVTVLKLSLPAEDKEVKRLIELREMIRTIPTDG